jgi:hypothetical protein
MTANHPKVDTETAQNVQKLLAQLGELPSGGRGLALAEVITAVLQGSKI